VAKKKVKGKKKWRLHWWRIPISVRETIRHCS
jgi:hypothetical protein